MKCDCFDFKEEYTLIKEYKYWKFYLAESQFLIGWCHAVLKRHVLFFEDLTDEELIEYKEIVKDWKKMLNATFEPDWFNIMQLGNMTSHLHFQMAPRYKRPILYEGREFIDEAWGKLIPHKWPVENEEFLTKLRKHLEKNL